MGISPVGVAQASGVLVLEVSRGKDWTYPIEKVIEMVNLRNVTTVTVKPVCEDRSSGPGAQPVAQRFV